MTVSEYKKNLWTYEKRRKEHQDALQRLNKKICQTRWRIKLKEAGEIKSMRTIENLVRLVNYYFSVDIKSKSWDKTHTLARFIYYKIALESRLKSAQVCRVLNKNSKAASYGRKMLNKSFKTNPENKEAYYNFKNFYKNNKHEQIIPTTIQGI